MKTRLFEKIAALLVLLLALGVVTFADESKQTYSSSSVSSKNDDSEEEAAKQEATASRARRGLSFLDRMYSDLRNNATFSFRFTENYSSNVLSSNFNRQKDTFSTFNPRFVANFQRQRYQFDLGYVAGYQIYNKFSNLNRSEHFGSLDYRFQMSPRTFLRLGDRASYTQYDIISGINQLLPPSPSPVATPPSVFFSRQRIFRNSVSGGLDYQISPQTAARIYGGYNLERYRNNVLNNLNGYVTGFDLEHRATRRFSISTGYDFSYYEYNNDLRNSTIHTVSTGFRYLVTPSFALFASGGLQTATVQGNNRGGGSFATGFEKSYTASLFAFGYERKLTNNIGLAAPVRAHIISALYRHRFTRWMNFQVDSAYARRRLTFVQTAPAQSFSAGSRLEFAVRPDLTFFLSYGYLNQRARILFLQVPN